MLVRTDYDNHSPYRRQAIYGQLRADIVKILRELCGRKGVIIEACPDHIYVCGNTAEIQRGLNNGTS